MISLHDHLYPQQVHQQPLFISSTARKDNTHLTYREVVHKEAMYDNYMHTKLYLYFSYFRDLCIYSFMDLLVLIMYLSCSIQSNTYQER